MITWRRFFHVVLLLSMLVFSKEAAAQSGTIIVNTTSDIEDFGGAKTTPNLPGPDGVVSLREAVIAANNTLGPNTIGFNIPVTDPGFGIAGFSGQFVIFVEGDPLIVTDSYTTIDGKTQTAFTGDTAVASEVHLRTTAPYMNMSGIYLNSNNNLVTGLDGFSLFRSGIEINGNSNVIVGNSIVQANSAGVSVSGANNRIGGTTSADRNRILASGTGVHISGAGATGTLVQGNLIWMNNSNGVTIDFGASGNTVGGASQGARNFIYSNGHTDSQYFPVGSDVSISSNNNLVQGNYIGVDESGAAAGGSVWSGVALSGQFNTIRGNLISGHTGYYTKLTARPAGIRITGGGNNLIQGNRIGTDASGTQPMPNEYGIKVEVWLSSDVTHDNQIGGRGAGEANIIAYNIYDGVAISGNKTRISANSIFSNGELGINLAPDLYTQTYPNTVTPNDPGDLDTGPNNLQNFPIITSSSDNGSSTTVQGTIDTQTPQQITIELFSNNTADASGFGEGQTFRGTTTPDATGNWVATLPGGLSGKYLTATATDAVGNTSEFSRAVLVGGSATKLPPTATPTPISVPSSTPASSPANMLGNASFELDANNDGKPDVWTINNKFTRSNTMVYGSTYAGRFYATDNSGVTTKQVVKNVTPGSVYTFSGWVNIPPSSDAFTLKLQVKWRNASNNVISTNTIKTYTASTSGWNQVTASLTAPAGTTNAVMLIVVSSLNRTIYVDEFMLKR